MSKRVQYAILAVLTFCIALIPFLYPIYYATPDDPRYIALVSGAYTGTPLKELVYVGTILGSIEAHLYSIFPGWEWYSIIYFLLTILSYAAILFCILDVRIIGGMKFLIVSVATVLQIHLSLNPQFTILATQLSFTSLLLLLLAEGRRYYCILGFILFFFASQMRLTAAFLPYMVAGPIFFADMNTQRKLWRRRLTYLFGVISIACVTFFADSFAYADEKWESFHITNDARAYVADNPIAANYVSEIVDKEERLAFDLYYRYRIFDLNILTPEKFQEYRQIFADRSLSTIRCNVKPYLQVYLRMGLWMVILLSLFLLVYLVRERRWWLLLLFCLVWFLFTMANLQMMSFSFYKERVMLGTFLSLFFAVGYLAYHSTNRFGIWLQCCCVVALLQILPRTYHELRGARTERAIVAETERAISMAQTDKVMLTVPVELTPEAFHISESPIYTHSVIQGWMHFYPEVSPVYQPFTAFFDGLPLLIERNSQEQVDMICQLLKMHYGVDVQVRMIGETEHYVLLALQKD